MMQYYAANAATEKNNGSPATAFGRSNGHSNKASRPHVVFALFLVKFPLLLCGRILVLLIL